MILRNPQAPHIWTNLEKFTKSQKKYSFIHFIGPNFKESVQARKMLLSPLHSSHS